MKSLYFTLALCALFITVHGQVDDNVLMRIDGHEISSEEFIRVYQKNSDITPTSEKKSLDEYLELFINYKLKVIEAQNLGLDTSATFLQEINGYRDQLAKPYLENGKQNDTLVQEAYSRYLEEINASHILIKVPNGATPEDTLHAYEKIMGIRERVVAGEPFNEVAKASSDDPSAKENGGDLGWFTVFQMVYPFETHAYATEVGKVSMPFRTSFGYHILKVNDRRNSRGKALVAQIMTELPRGANNLEKQAAKEQIQKAYADLQNGMPWSDAVNQYSDHQRSRGNNGELGWLQTGMAPNNFLDTCYSLSLQEYSKPVETRYGFHIIKVLDRKEIESFAEVRDRFLRKVSQDSRRAASVHQDVIRSLKEQHGFAMNSDILNDLVSQADSNLHKHAWKPSAVNPKDTIFIIGKAAYTCKDFIQSANRRNSYNSKAPLTAQLHQLFRTDMEGFIYTYGKESLPETNSDYKYLLQEYHDGILLFNLTNQMVWNKAQEDSLGLQAFYKAYTDKYEWNKRMQVSIYTYKNEALTSSVLKWAKKRTKKNISMKTMNDAICPGDTIPCVVFENKTYEKDVHDITEKLSWEKGAYIKDAVNNEINIYYVNKVISPQVKSLDEAKGLYIAAFQTDLEQKWIADLREKYEIEIDQEVLKTLKN